MIPHFANLFKQYLTQLYSEIELLPEEFLWSVRGQITNSPGNLALHLCGNLQTFVGNGIGGKPYVRNREEEFSGRIEKASLLELIKFTQNLCEDVFNHFDDDRLKESIEIKITSLNGEVSIGYLLTHLSAHLGYHTGQINYFRRMLS